MKDKRGVGWRLSRGQRCCSMSMSIGTFSWATLDDVLGRFRLGAGLYPGHLLPVAVSALIGRLRIFRELRVTSGNFGQSSPCNEAL